MGCNTSSTNKKQVDNAAIVRADTATLEGKNAFPTVDTSKRTKSKKEVFPEHKIKFHMKSMSPDFYKEYKDKNVMKFHLEEEKMGELFSDFIRDAEGFILPDVDTIEFKILKGFNIYQFKGLLMDLFPSQVKNFIFHSTDPKLPKFYDYVYSTQKSSLNVLNQFSLSRFTIDRTVFKQIITNFGHVDKIEFVKCRIETEKVDLGKKLACRIKNLTFKHCMNETFSDWEKHPQGLWDLLEEVSKCPLKDSLLTFGVTENSAHSVVDKEYIQDLFNHYKIEHIKLDCQYEGEEKVEEDDLFLKPGSARKK